MGAGLHVRQKGWKGVHRGHLGWFVSSQGQLRCGSGRRRPEQGTGVPQRPHSLLHDHVAQGVAQGVILVVQHERDAVPVRPIRLDLSPVREERSCDLPEVGDT